MQQTLMVNYVQTNSTHSCRTYHLLHIATTRYLVIFCTYAFRSHCVSSLCLRLTSHFVCLGKGCRCI